MRKYGICPAVNITFCVTSCMGRKKQGFWPRINCSQMKLPDFESPSGLPILDIQSEFSMSKIIPIFLKKNSLKKINLGTPFFVKSIFC
jgi:hypothetical protein